MNEVHRFTEDRRLRFVLLGSSARKLKQAGTNLLAGRALRRLMLPLVPQAFTAVEAKAKPTLGTRDLKGFRAIADLSGIRRRIVVFLGDRPFRTDDGIEALPVGHFVRELERGDV